MNYKKINEYLTFGYNNLRENNFIEAERYFDWILSKQIDNFDALMYNSIIKEKLFKYDHAIALGAKAILVGKKHLQKTNRIADVNRCYALIHFNVGICNHHQKEYLAAKHHFLQAISYRPDYVDAYVNLGIALRMLGEYEESLKLCIKFQGISLSLEEGPWLESLMKLKLGDFSGWDKYEVRHILHRVNNSQFNLWKGEPLEGKTLIILSEQGFGDTLQFCRYAKMVKNLGAKKVIFVVHKGLMKMMKTVEGIDEVIESNIDQSEITVKMLPKADYHVWLLSLPGIFKTNLDNIPASIPYFSASQKDIKIWKKKLSQYTGKRIGIVWAGASRNQPNAYEINLMRSMTLKQFEPLLSIPDIHFFNLQKDESKKQILELPGCKLIDFMDEVFDFTETAALVENLDLVITVDSAMCHLVGGLGKPVWMLSRYDGCWRWLLNRTDTPWYPSMKIYNQNNLRDWDEVINRVKNDLGSPSKSC